MKQLRIILLFIGVMCLSQRTFCQRALGQIMQNPPPILTQQQANEFHPDAKILDQGLISYHHPIWHLTFLYNTSTNKFQHENNHNF